MVESNLVTPKERTDLLSTVVSYPCYKLAMLKQIITKVLTKLIVNS
jgi:hypothetical protein